jgi:hypothetical protein
MFIPARARACAKSVDVMENPVPGFEPPPAAPLDRVEPEGIVKFPNELEVEAPPAADVGGLWLVKPVIPPIPVKLYVFFSNFSRLNITLFSEGNVALWLLIYVLFE